MCVIHSKGKKKLTREDGYNLSILMQAVPRSTKSVKRVNESCLKFLVVFFVCFRSELDG